MKKTIKVENLDCANCASKIEKAINKVEGVESANVNFITQKIKLELIMKEIKRVCKKVEPDCTLLDD